MYIYQAEIAPLPVVEKGIPGTLHGSHNNNTSEQIMYHLTKSRKKKKNNERKKTKIKKKNYPDAAGEI